MEQTQSVGKLNQPAAKPLWQRIVTAGLRFEATVNGLRGAEKFLIMSIFFLWLLPFYLFAARQQLIHVNMDNFWVDQDAYVNYAVRLHETDYAYIGDHNRMPVYPWLMSQYYDPAMSVNGYFHLAKIVNIVLSVGLLAILFVILLQLFPTLTAMNLLLVPMFTLYIFKAPFIQVELLYYAVTLLTFALTMRLFVRPSWWLGILTGLMLGFTHLTKASVLPGLIALLTFLTLKMLYTLWREDNRFKQAGQQALTMGLVIIIFFAVIWPYIRTSKEVFGHYFYNVNSTFYIWYDSWEEAKQGVRQHGDYVGWPDMPEEEIPSFQKYIREHSALETADRFGYGIVVSFQRHFYRGGYGYIWYVLAFIGMTLLFLRQTYKSERRSELVQLIEKHAFLILFCLAYFSGYLTLYVFYARIHPGQRFMLMLLMPALFSLMMIMGLPIFRSLKTTLAGQEIRWYTLFNLTLFMVILIHGFLNVVHGSSVIRGGG